MPVIPGDMGIKSWSYEIVVVGDGVDSWELCEDCAKEDGFEPDSDAVTPIFADTEMDRNPHCDNCHYTSFIFSPTAECVNNWTEMLYEYCLTRWGDTDFLDRVSEQMYFVTDDPLDLATMELYDQVRVIPKWLERRAYALSERQTT